MRYFLSIALLSGSLLLSLQTSAQTKKAFTDSSATLEHFVGFQANALLQQIFNFGESDDLANPYVVKYSLKHVPTGLTFNAGGGINRNSSSEESGLVTENESYDLRLGLGWQKAISKRLELGVGADIIFGRSFRESSTVNTVVFGVGLDSTVTVIKNKSTYIGYGAQLNLSFKLTPTLLIGTEASLYAYSTETIENTNIDNFFIGTNFEEELTTRSILNENTNTEGEKIDLNLPIVLFLILRF